MTTIDIINRVRGIARDLGHKANNELERAKTHALEAIRGEDPERRSDERAQAFRELGAHEATRHAMRILDTFATGLHQNSQP